MKEYIVRCENNKFTIKGKNVRCKDCKWFDSKRANFVDGYGYCERYEVTDKDSHYCGYGEHKEKHQLSEETSTISEKHQLMLPLDDAVKVVGRICDEWWTLNDGDIEFIRNELEQKCYMIDQTTDCISRADTIKALCQECEMKCVCNHDCTEVAVVKGMPPVNKKQVTSKLESAENATSEGEESTMNQPKGKLDCISRQDAIEALMAHFIPQTYTGEQVEQAEKLAQKIMNKVPPVEPPKKVIVQIRVDTDELMERIKEEYEITDKPVCEDAISRQAVEEMIKAEMPERGMWEIEGDKVKETVCEVCADLMQELSKLPPVVLKRSKGTETMMVDGEPTEIDPLSYEVGYTHGQFSERPEGEWKDRIFDGCLERECDQCGEMIDAYIFRQNRYNYCPNCGADMKGDKK